MPTFIVFGLTQPGIKPSSISSVAGVLSARPLIGFDLRVDDYLLLKYSRRQCTLLPLPGPKHKI